MVKIVAKNFIKADKVNEFVELASKLVEATVREDEGCIQYELYQDVSDPTLMIMIEAWEDKESLDRHMASKHFTETVPTLHDLASKPGEMNMYQKLA